MTRRRLTLFLVPVGLIAVAAIAQARSVMLGYDFTGFRRDAVAAAGEGAKAGTPMLSLAYWIDDLVSEPTVLRSNAEPSPRLPYERVI